MSFCNFRRMSLPLDRLTAKQRQCLRLVHTGQTSKQIAQTLAISSHTVDQRLRQAIHTLGVSNRREAAALLAEMELAGSYQALMYQSPHIAGGRRWTDPFRVVGALFAPADQKEAKRREAEIIAAANRNELTRFERLLFIACVAFAAANSFGLLLVSMHTLSGLF